MSVNYLDCRKCPKGGHCSGLNVVCPAGYISNGVECIHTTVFLQIGTEF